jgi:hypothetical protein
MRSSGLPSKLTLFSRGMSPGPRPETIHLDESIVAGAAARQGPSRERALHRVVELDELPVDAETLG